MSKMLLHYITLNSDTHSLLFFIKEVDQSDCIEELIFNGALRLNI